MRQFRYVWQCEDRHETCKRTYEVTEFTYKLVDFLTGYGVCSGWQKRLLLKNPRNVRELQSYLKKRYRNGNPVGYEKLMLFILFSGGKSSSWVCKKLFDF